MDLKNRISEIENIEKEIKKDIGESKSTCITFKKQFNVKKRKQALLVDLDKNVLSLLTKRLGTKDSLDAETWSACFPLVTATINKKDVLFCGELNVALKIAPTKFNEMTLEDRAWKEYYILLKTTEIVKRGGIPNLPVLYLQTTCDKMKYSDYQNKRLIDRMKREKIKKKALFIFNELADYDLEYWIKHKLESNLGMIKPLAFQIFSALAAVNRYLHLVHFDLHIGNILVTELENNTGYLHYRIDGDDYYVPNVGYIFTLWDFSRSIILDQESTDLAIKKFLFHGKRNFGNSFYQYRSEIETNLQNENYIPYFYSSDTLRFSKSIVTILQKREIESKFTSDLIKIAQLAATDIKQKVKSKTIPKEYKSIPINIIKEFFKDYKKKPDNYASEYPIYVF